MQLEADWEAEVGEGLPVIELPWSGYVDLRQNASAIQDIEETTRYPALAEALRRLNAADSPLATAKCDVWMLTEPVDEYELDTDPANARSAIASYIDVVFLDRSKAGSFRVCEDWARKLAVTLHEIPAKNGRVDCVLRSAWLDGANAFGLTIYATGCGADDVAAEANWKNVLQHVAEATIATAHCSQAGE
jgi:hypothetical protein